MTPDDSGIHAQGSSRSASSSPRVGALVGRASLAALMISVSGGTAIALVECGAATFKYRSHFDSDFQPAAFILSCIGRVALGYALVMLPMLLVLGGGYVALRCRTAKPTPEPFLAASFVGLATLLVVPMDLYVIHIRSMPIIVATCVGGLLAAVSLHLIYRRLMLKTAPRICRIASYSITIPLSLLFVTCCVVFVRSSLFDPDSYVPPARTVMEMKPDRPHILWIDLDTVRPDRMSCYGYRNPQRPYRPTTPFMDQWAKNAIVFDRAVGDGMWTVPTHASMFTGMSVRQHGVDGEHAHLDDCHVTLADRLSEEGYVSAFFSNNPWLSRETNLVKGFQTVRDVYHLRKISRGSLDFLLEWGGVTPRQCWFDLDFGAALTNQWAAEWLDQEADGGAPLFLFVNYMEAHLPYRVPCRYRRMYMTETEVDRSYDLRNRVYGSIVEAMDVRYNCENADFLADADRNILRNQYDACIRYLDDQAYCLISMLRQRGLLDDTLVVITSDHGEYLGTHGMWAHRFQVYDDLTRVAIILREPGRTEGLRVSTPVQQSDLYTTLLRLALGAAPAESGPMAQDIFDTARMGGRERIVVAQYSGAGRGSRARLFASDDPEKHLRAIKQLAAVDGRFKYIASDDGRRELYDLVQDPNELINLVAVRPKESHRLASFLESWVQSVPPYRPPQLDKAKAMNRVTLDAIRGLGYIDAGEGD